ncbi:class I adenylate-forming enzyme family protein [Halorarum salinum]|uniref:AMP-binding protein n=1 Tax=Halorarum salinum TaxID=2743089 RepID=A0A7D5LDK7_9EURY|nr:AMP-binding protein [Halobaculum salinum]QLG64171.1 AMP-binding protein [Halobaculum salinum]
MNYLSAFERTVRCYGDETAVVTDDGREFTYDEFDRRSTRLANALSDRLGGGRCAVLALNGPAAVESMIAGHKRGSATVQLSFRGMAEELVRMAENADAEGLVFDDANADTALEMLDRGEFGTAIHVGDRELDADGVESYEDVLDGAADTLHADLPAGEECTVFYTSGTTSRPKAVPFDGEDMWYGAVQVVMEHGVDETDTAIVTTPWYHMVTSDAWLYPHFLAGATVVLHESFDPAEALELVEEHDATGLLAVPTQLDALNDVQAEVGYDTGSLEYVRTGGAIVTEELVERTRSLLSEGLYNTYGMTEAGPDLTFAHPSAQDEHPGTIGKEAFTWELRVVEPAPVDEHPDPEATVDPGERGEIIARGPGKSDGYIDNEAAQRKSYFGEWLRTRDVARVDEDGYLYVVDRVDNMFTCGGENVYPAEVEHALGGHEAVEEALVFGLEDDHWGRKVTAVVVADGSVDGEDLDEFCREHGSLANYKRPRTYAVRTEPLPRTDTGTVERGRVIDDHFG